MVRYNKNRFSFQNLFPIVSTLERQMLKPQGLRMSVTISFWLLSFIWMIFCIKVAGFRYPKDGIPLSDFLYEILPEEVNLDPMPDVILAALLLSFVIRIIYHQGGLGIARRFITICGVMFFIRGLTFVSTQYPEARPECQGYSHTWELSTVLSRPCGDIMFSLHAIIFSLVSLCWLQYTSSVIMKATVCVIALSGMLSLIISRHQYTVDVLMSLLGSTALWVLYHTHLLLPTRHRLRLVTWLEILGDAHEYETSNFNGSPSPVKLSSFIPAEQVTHESVILGVSNDNIDALHVEESISGPSSNPSTPLNKIQNMLQLTPSMKDYQELETQVNY